MFTNCECWRNIQIQCHLPNKLKKIKVGKGSVCFEEKNPVIDWVRISEFATDSEETVIQYKSYLIEGSSPDRIAIIKTG